MANVGRLSMRLLGNSLRTPMASNALRTQARDMYNPLLRSLHTTSAARSTRFDPPTEKEYVPTREEYDYVHDRHYLYIYYEPLKPWKAWLYVGGFVLLLPATLLHSIVYFQQKKAGVW